MDIDFLLWHTPERCQQDINVVLFFLSLPYPVFLMHPYFPNTVHENLGSFFWQEQYPAIKQESLFMVASL